MTKRDRQRPGTQIAEMSETVEEAVAAVAVTLQSGSVRVVAGGDSATRIDAEIECDEDDPLPTISWTVEEGRLAIDVQVPEATGRGTVELTITAPPAAAVEVNAQFARIEVIGRRAPLDLTTNAGSIHVTDSQGDLTLRSRAAAISVNDVHAESVLLETQAGSIVAERLDVQYAKVASHVGRVVAAFTTRPRIVEASTTVGKLNVAVPSGVYSANLNGRVRLGDGITIASGSEHQLDVSVTLGTARIAASDA